MKSLIKQKFKGYRCKSDMPLSIKGHLKLCLQCFKSSIRFSGVSRLKKVGEEKASARGRNQKLDILTQGYSFLL